jgi:hypothetical protein
MTLIDAQKSDEGAAPAEDQPAQALFPEAKRRERQRRLLVLGAVLGSVLAAAGLAVGLVAWWGGGPPRHRGAVPRSGHGRAAVPPAGPIVLRGNGIGGASFGQAEPVAIAALEQVLGTPISPEPQPSNNCTIDSYLEWPTMTAFFDHQRFVGYGTGTYLRYGKRDSRDASTAAGLRVGNTLGQARRDYGADLTTSYAQGGSWFAATPSGQLGGDLTSEVDQSGALIADITAGAVGCPAESP